MSIQLLEFGPFHAEFGIICAVLGLKKRSGVIRVRSGSLLFFLDRVGFSDSRLFGRIQIADQWSLPGFDDLGTLHRSGTQGVYPSGQRGQAVNLLAFAFGGSNPPAPIIKSFPGNQLRAKKRMARPENSLPLLSKGDLELNSLLLAEGHLLRGGSFH